MSEVGTGQEFCRHCRLPMAECTHMYVRCELTADCEAFIRECDALREKLKRIDEEDDRLRAGLFDRDVEIDKLNDRIRELEQKLAEMKKALRDSYKWIKTHGDHLQNEDFSCALLTILPLSEIRRENCDCGLGELQNKNEQALAERGEEGKLMPEHEGNCETKDPGNFNPRCTCREAPR